MALSWASSIQQTLRDKLVYGSGYLQGRTSDIPRSVTGIYTWIVAKITRMALLPLPVVSFLVIPFYGGASTTINLLFFYMTWSALVLSHDPLSVEIYGTLAVRLLLFLLPALAFVGFDCAIPSLSRAVKARGDSHLPLGLGHRKLRHVVTVAVGNVLLSVLLQAVLEVIVTRGLFLRSLLRVTTTVPLPWNIAKDVLHGFVWRGVLRYAIHRYLLHSNDSLPFQAWHMRWQHSIRLPFSLVAAYDHPVNHLLSQWLPVFAPAVVFRFHVLTWHILLAVVSLEDLLAYSGYDVLPSSIILTSMARRTDKHFEACAAGRRDGNFGQLGVLDFCCGTAIRGDDDLASVIQREDEKHRASERLHDAASGAKDGFQRKGSDSRSRDEHRGLIDRVTRGLGSRSSVQRAAEDGLDGTANEDAESGGQLNAGDRRRGPRRRARKE